MELMLFFIQSAALLGLLLSLYLLAQKSRKRKIFCPFKDQCNEVLNSRYAKIFGIPTLLMGVIYYGAVFFGATFAAANPDILNEFPLEIFFYTAIAAVIFSLYQTAIQMFSLKKWCSWCLESTALSIILLIMAWMLMA